MSLALRNLAILIVDGDANSCQPLQSLLEEFGASVMVARSVEDALKLQRQSPPHVVIADIHLGSSDNCALIKAIRKRNLEYGLFTPAIAITDFASHAEQKRAMMAGFNAYVPKSIEPAFIVNTITRLLRASTDFAA